MEIKHTIECQLELVWMLEETHTRKRELVRPVPIDVHKM